MIDVRIRLATRSDIPGVMALEERHYVGNLSESERADGFISVRHSAEWFERAIDRDGLHVAVTEDDRIGGFIAVIPPPPTPDPELPAVVRAMTELARTVALNGTPIATRRYALRGPVCIGAELRGRGVYTAFNAVTRAAYRDVYDVGVLFVAADNPRSLNTTTRKLGAQVLADFEADGRKFHFLAFEFPPRPD